MDGSKELQTKSFKNTRLTLITSMLFLPCWIVSMEESVETRFEGAKSGVSAFRGIKATLLQEIRQILKTKATTTTEMIAPPQTHPSFTFPSAESSSQFLPFLELPTGAQKEPPERAWAEAPSRICDDFCHCVKGLLKAIRSFLFPHKKLSHYAYLGVLLEACKVFSVILLGWLTLELWFDSCMEFLSSKKGIAMFRTPRGVEDKSLLFTAGFCCTAGQLGSMIRFGGVPSTGLGTGDAILGEWPFFIFFSAVLGVLTLKSGLSLSGIPSSPSSNVTKEQ